jgi:hypothetical protein
MAASTCVVGSLDFAAASPNRHGPVTTSRERGLITGVLDMTSDDSELLASFQVSPTKTLSRGYLLLGGQCEVFLGK